MEVLRKKRNGLVEDMKSRNEESKQIESEILQKGLEIETVNSQNKNFIKVRLFKKKIGSYFNEEGPNFFYRGSHFF